MGVKENLYILFGVYFAFCHVYAMECLKMNLK